MATAPAPMPTQTEELRELRETLIRALDLTGNVARRVGLRSELLASVPLRLFRRTADGGTRARR